MSYIDITALRAMRTRNGFTKVSAVIDTRQHNTEVSLIISAIEKYYTTYDNHVQIDFAIFIPFINNHYLKDKPEDHTQAVLNIVKNMAKTMLDEETQSNLINDLHELQLVHKAQKVIESYVEGKEVDVPSELTNLLGVYDKEVQIKNIPVVSYDIDFLLEDDTKNGFTWRLNCLNACMRPLLAGDLVIVAARPDAGKTSFLCSEITHMATQIKDDRPIVWLNNEGLGSRIIPRLIQSALDITIDDLKKLKQSELHYVEYEKIIGKRERIQVLDIHGWKYWDVEKVLKELNPCIVIWDMVDNVRGFSDAARTDLALEYMHQWVRENGVKHGYASIATSQISSEGANTMYPPLSSLKDSKTGKQGACDTQIMIGSLDDPNLGNTRWLSVPKNKLRKVNSYPLEERVVFDKERARYRDA